MTSERVQKTFLLLLLAAVSLLFLAMIRPFLMTIVLAAIAAGLCNPLYRRLTRWLRGRRVLAAAVVLVAVLVVVVAPLATLTGVVVNEGFKVTDTVRPWVQQRIEDPTYVERRIATLPYSEFLLEHRAEIYRKAGEVVGGVGNWLVGNLSDVTKGTVSFLFQLGVLLYAMFFFLLDGRKMLRRILFFLPLSDEAEREMVEKFVSVTRATIKGTLVIGILQGTLAGLAFGVVGIPSAVFWSVVMMVLSIIPGVGTAIVWVPAVIILAVTDRWGAAIGLGIWCALVVGSIDNVLRPRLVGQDTKMHELLILCATLGGISLFGILGFIVGPILAAIFVTVWELYGHVFRDALPEVRWLDDDEAKSG